MGSRNEVKKMHKKLLKLEKKRQEREKRRTKDELAQLYVLLDIAQDKIQEIFRRY